jgi:RNA ligase (TIGR02306 family)
MSEFVCEVMRIDAVEQHPNADRLKIVKIRGFNCISGDLEDGTARYKAGDLVVYIPEGAVLETPMLKACGFWDEANNKGMLAGSLGNRVKAIKLRGIVSQGILFPLTEVSPVQKQYMGFEWDGFMIAPKEYHNGYLNQYFVNVGENVADKLRITKYIPEIPVHMSGQVVFIGQENTVNFDIENIQKYPDIFEEGEEVVITEKLHGTFCCLGYVAALDKEEFLDGHFFAFSKGQGADGLVFQNSEVNSGNLYHKTLLKYHDKFTDFLTDRYTLMTGSVFIFIMGEIYGKGVQDLTYGTTEPEFRFFAVAVRNKQGELRYLSEKTLEYVSKYFERVPVLYRGPFSNEKVTELRDGKTILGGVNIREGVVVTPVEERTDPTIGRVALKAVSPDYLLRKGNATEFA